MWLCALQCIIKGLIQPMVSSNGSGGRKQLWKLAKKLSRHSTLRHTGFFPHIKSRLSLEPLEWNFPRGGETGALVNFHARVHDIIEEIVKPLRFRKS